MENKKSVILFVAGITIFSYQNFKLSQKVDNLTKYVGSVSASQQTLSDDAEDLMDKMTNSLDHVLSFRPPVYDDGMIFFNASATVDESAFDVTSNTVDVAINFELKQSTKEDMVFLKATDSLGKTKESQAQQISGGGYMVHMALDPNQEYKVIVTQSTNGVYKSNKLMSINPGQIIFERFKYVFEGGTRELPAPNEQGATIYQVMSLENLYRGDEKLKIKSIIHMVKDGTNDSIIQQWDMMPYIKDDGVKQTIRDMDFDTLYAFYQDGRYQYDQASQIVIIEDGYGIKITFDVKLQSVVDICSVNSKQ